MATATYDEKAYEELKKQHRIEWQERKARRFEKASQHAQVLARIPSNGSIIEIRRAMRSRGYSSGYKQVPQYWALEYKEGKLTHGRSLTEGAYREAKAYAFKNKGIILP